MNEWFGEKYKDIFWQFIIAVLLLVIGIICYISLQTIAKPYYIQNEATIAGDQAIRTYLVINPGPWKERKPKLEFEPLPGGRIIGQSPGVTSENTLNRVIIFPSDGLPPGCAYYVVYQYTRTANITPHVSVMCDGKPCKQDPSFDMDVILKLQQLSALIFFIFGIFCCIIFFKTRSELKAEQQHTIRHSLESLISSLQNISDKQAVQEASATINTLPSLSQEMQSVSPKRIKGNKNGKKN